MKKQNWVILLCCSIFLVAACQTEAKDACASNIQTIDFFHSSFGHRLTEYRVDMETCVLYTYMAKQDDAEFSVRDPSQENDGFDTVEPFDADKLPAFIQSANKHGFCQWLEEYNNIDLKDGHQWGITIQYNDGSQKDFWGSNAYPDSWDAMRDSLMLLTGEDLLTVSSTWPDADCGY